MAERTFGLPKRLSSSFPDSDFQASHRICTFKNVDELLECLRNADIPSNGTIEAAIGHHARSNHLWLLFKKMRSVDSVRSRNLIKR